MLKLTSVFCGSSFILSISLIVLGAMIWASGSRLPEYNDPNWEEPFNDPSWTAHLDVAFEKSTHDDRKDFDAMCDEWYAA